MANLITIFEETVRRDGDRVAVEVQRKDALDRLTYRDLDALRLDRLRQLQACGVRPGDRCAILAHNDAHWCAAYLAVLSAGAAVVPFDTNYSATQVATILRDSGARVLFASERLGQVATDALSAVTGVARLDIHAPSEPPIAEQPVPGRQVAADETAVILYTSGTTSDPKGVMLTHANLIAERDSAFAVVNVSSEDSVLGVLPLFHSLAQLANLLLPFAVGARVVYLETLNSQELVRALSERRITIFACVPQFFYLIHERIMREVSRKGPAARLAFRTLIETSFRLRRMGLNVGPSLFGKVHDIMGRQMRLFVTGGSKFDPAIGRDLYALGFTILQAYGLTETSGACTINTPDEAHVDTVGRPLPGTEITILPRQSGDDEHADGEVAIRGPLVMKGYFNRPDATAAVMKDGWFLSGDLGRMDAQGRVTITGRKKEVIILANGKNIYPEEIEAHYRQSPFVKELCVTTIAQDDKPAGERLYAVVVPDMDVLKERKVVNVGDMLRFEMEGLGAKLPSTKRVLGYEITFDPLPRTSTGKLKRHEIVRRLSQARADAAAPAPSSADAAWPDDGHTQEALALARQRIGASAVMRPGSNLELDLGLDSMSRVELLNEFEQRFGVKVPEEETHHIFTLGQLVDAVRPREGATAPTATAVESWATLLRDLPADTDPVLKNLLAGRSLLRPWLFAGSRLLRPAFGRVEVTGLEHLPRSGAFLICPNHQSYVDAFVIHGVLPYWVQARLFFVGAAEYFSTPLMAAVARAINLVPVDPDANLVPAMKAGAFGLRHERILMIFPEGERSIDGTVKRFKKGAPILSRYLNVPIIPVALRGAYEVWPRNASFQWAGALPGQRHHVRVAFGPPFHVRPEESDAEAAARLRDVVDALWQRI
jgi:long-chain acyl-CoA synthetase